MILAREQYIYQREGNLFSNAHRFQGHRSSRERMLSQKKIE